MIFGPFWEHLHKCKIKTTPLVIAGLIIKRGHGFLSCWGLGTGVSQLLPAFSSCYNKLLTTSSSSCTAEGQNSSGDDPLPSSVSILLFTVCVVVFLLFFILSFLDFQCPPPRRALLFYLLDSGFMSFLVSLPLKVQPAKGSIPSSSFLQVHVLLRSHIQVCLPSVPSLYQLDPLNVLLQHIYSWWYHAWTKPWFAGSFSPTMGAKDISSPRVEDQQQSKSGAQDEQTHPLAHSNKLCSLLPTFLETIRTFWSHVCFNLFGFTSI